MTMTVKKKFEGIHKLRRQARGEEGVSQMTTYATT